ncbi:integrase catalytic domain-containing protein [Bacillus sp. DJP31]|uniref:integrase catalytic domain-containing protein n=1 Tax=Bacillus sp. DJP31 TaxID=3409789 RepID=UPI003BB5EAE6
MFIPNTVIQWKVGTKENLYERILWIDRTIDIAIVFPLYEKGGLPQYCSLSELESALEQELLIKRTTDPYTRTVDEEFINNHKKKMDTSWNRIKDLVLDEPDIYDPSLRGPMIEEAIKRHKTTKKTLYKSMRKYWKYGKVPIALLPSYDSSGGPGKTREITDEMIEEALKEGKTIKKRGRPPIGVEYHPELEGVNVTKTDKENILKSYKKNYEKTSKPQLTKAYRDYLNEYCTVKEQVNGEEKELLDPTKKYISLHQYKTVIYENRDLKRTLIKREGEKGFNLRERAVLGSSTHIKMGPGSVYQMDATPLSLYVVSRYNPEKIIGKATIYLLMDVFSRFITGCYIGLGHSWDDAKMAVLDSFLNRGLIFNKNEDDLLKECYIPQVILTDKGSELIGKDSDNLTNFFGIRVTNAASYRADWKGIVEQQFNQIRQKILDLPGVVKKGFRERGEKDYRQEAALNLDDLTDAIKAIVEWHNYQNYMSSYVLESDMISDSVEPYPEQLWNWGLKNRNGALNQTTPELAIVNLLSKTQGVISEFGIRFGEKKYYTCELAIKEQWFLRNGPHNGKKVGLAFDTRNNDVVYLLLDGGNQIERCNLMERSKRYVNRRYEEAVHLIHDEKIKENVKEHSYTESKINLDNKLLEIAEKANQKTQEYLKTSNVSPRKRVKDITENKHEAREGIRQEVSDKLFEQLNPNKKSFDYDLKDELEMEDNIELKPNLSPQKSIHNKMKSWKVK